MTVQVVHNDDMYEFEGKELRWTIGDSSIGATTGLLTIFDGDTRVASFRNWDNISRVQEDKPAEKLKYTVEDGVIDATKLFQTLKDLGKHL